jgi:hypothetical protein
MAKIKLIRKRQQAKPKDETSTEQSPAPATKISAETAWQGVSKFQRTAACELRKAKEAGTLDAVVDVIASKLEQQSCEIERAFTDSVATVDETAAAELNAKIESEIARRVEAGELFKTQYKYKPIPLGGTGNHPASRKRWL